MNNMNFIIGIRVGSMNKLKKSFSHFKTQKSSPVVDIVWTDSESGDHCQRNGHFSLSVNYTSEPDD